MAKTRAKKAENEMFGPYELVDGANRLTFGADPVIRIDAGEKFTTQDPSVAAYLEAHPAVKKVSA